MKICIKCKVEKEESLFSIRSKSKDGLQSNCKACCKAYKELNKERAYTVHIAYKYGLTTEQHTNLVSLQGGKCAICLCTPRKRRLAVDHNHKTGEVRGLLCVRCNKDLLGLVRDRVEILQRAIDYLTNPPAQR